MSGLDGLWKKFIQGLEQRRHVHISRATVHDYRHESGFHHFIGTRSCPDRGFHVKCDAPLALRSHGQSDIDQLLLLDVQRRPCFGVLEKPQKRVGLRGVLFARVLAHVLMLEALDELGIRPALIAGSSMRAIIGALYASGHSGSDIRKFIDKIVFTDVVSWRSALIRKDIPKWIDFIDPELGHGGPIKHEHFIRYLHDAIHVIRFNELKIPLKVVTADFWKRTQIAIDSGELLPAVKASMALPGLFTPVELKGRILVDGGPALPGVRMLDFFCSGYYLPKGETCQAQVEVRACKDSELKINYCI